MSRVLVPLAEGFEEIEVVTIVDVLRRGDVDVTLAGLEGDAAVRGSHGIVVQPDIGLANIGPADAAFDMIVLPGGEPGTTHLAAHTGLRTLLEQHAGANRPLAAICAAPRVLAAAGMLRDRHATSHPSVEAQLRDAGALYDAKTRVVRDGAFITSRGPGTALEFALVALEVLGRGESARRLRDAMLVGSSG